MKKLFYILLSLSMTLSFTNCVDNDPEGDSYYTFTGEMVTDYLQNRNENFSEFIGILERAELWDLLSTYGTFTCFAPTNEAIEKYLKEHGLQTVDDL
ncbi:MAG: fasciclin domain-containing protein, partial [Bacteroidales bacterium]|nr:fasciclin domain-containing protein [Bacteroidales bacterium]